MSHPAPRLYKTRSASTDLGVAPSIGHQRPQPGRINEREELRGQITLVKDLARGRMLNRVAAHIRWRRQNPTAHTTCTRQPDQFLRDPRLNFHNLISLKPTHSRRLFSPGVPTSE
jgi:hypothetical protein